MARRSQQTSSLNGIVESGRADTSRQSDGGGSVAGQAGRRAAPRRATPLPRCWLAGQPQAPRLEGLALGGYGEVYFRLYVAQIRLSINGLALP